MPRWYLFVLILESIWWASFDTFFPRLPWGQPCKVVNGPSVASWHFEPVSVSDPVPCTETVKAMKVVPEKNAVRILWGRERGTQALGAQRLLQELVEDKTRWMKWEGKVRVSVACLSLTLDWSACGALKTCDAHGFRLFVQACPGTCSGSIPDTPVGTWNHVDTFLKVRGGTSVVLLQLA